MLALKRLSAETFTVQVQDPRVDARRFDLVVPPEHDGLTGSNVMPILGSPNGITHAKLDAAAAQWAKHFEALPHPRLAVLIGGKSKAHRFDEEDAVRLAMQLKDLAARGFGLMVTTSRRTGEAQAKILAQMLAGSRSVVWSGAGDNPYLGMLALADAIMVTSDSTNMAVEAAATGKPIHVVSIPGGSAKFDRLHASLARRGITRPFSGHIESWSYEPLDETGRVAATIRHKIGLENAVNAL
jgi:hypothetical protein